MVCVEMGAADPSKIWKGLAENKGFNIEKLLDDVPEDSLTSGREEPKPPTEGREEIVVQNISEKITLTC